MYTLRLKSHPEEAKQWDIGAIYDNPRPKYTKYDHSKPHIRPVRIYGPDDDDPTLLQWIKGGHDIASAWGEENEDSDGSRRIQKGRWKRGYLALDWASQNQPPIQIIKALYEVYPDAIHLKDVDGKVPLHQIIESNVSMDKVEYLMSRYPEGSRVQCNDGWTPLHWASQRHTTADVLDALLEGVHKEAAALQNKEGKLPLHIAAASGHRVAVEKLLKVYPDGAMVADQDGALPLHLAAKKDPHIAELIIEVRPESVEVADGSGMLPLHYCTMQGPFSSVELTEKIIDMYPRAASIQDSNGMLPLHWLAMRGANLPSVRLLLAAYPEGGSMMDRWGRTPAWIAYKRRKDRDRYEIVELMELDPDEWR